MSALNKIIKRLSFLLIYQPENVRKNTSHKTNCKMMTSLQGLKFNSFSD